MPAPGSSITRRARAKLNLSLSVGPAEPAGTMQDGRDVGGYHRVASWFVAIDLADELTLTCKSDREPTTHEIVWAPDAPRPTPIDWSRSDDLALRAHAALEKRLERSLPIDSRLIKRIPVGAGLGGGSSDAAAMLMALRDLFELDISTDDLRAIGATLGSDVPFFIDDGVFDTETDGESEEEPASAAPLPRPALVTSFGEVIERADTPPSDVILIIPPFQCATREVYKAFDTQLDERVRAKKRELSLRDGDAAAERYRPQPARDDLIAKRIDKANRSGRIDADTLFNDLFLPALSVQPALGPIVTNLSKATRHPAHLTGSGSAIFMLAPAGRVDKLLAQVRAALDSMPKTDDNQIAAIATRLL